MCERGVKVIKLSDLRRKLGTCCVNCRRGLISIRISEISQDKIDYLNEFSIPDDTVHSKRQYQRWVVKFGTVLVNDRQ